MLKAKLDSVRKNKKGFFLVELIIVIAIMVALIAVMAPAFVKYVQKSRDAAIATAAEDYEKAVQTYIGDPDTDMSKITASQTILVYVDSTTNKLKVVHSNTNIESALNTLAGADTTKKMGSTTAAYKIIITKDASNNDVSVKMQKGTQNAGTFTADA